jgi:DNA-binding beta-propeller fold protein YncE
MIKPTAQEFTIATPTGQRVLVAIEPSNYASVRDGFEPRSDNSSQRLRLRDRDPNMITVSPDGTWINHRQLYAIANGIVKKLGTPLLAVSIGDALFFDGYRPDVAAVFRSVFATYNENDKWWKEMYRISRFDSSMAALRPVNPRF